MKYRKKPIIVDAMQFDGENGNSVVQWVIDNGGIGQTVFNAYKKIMLIRTLEGEMTARPKDWIIRGVSGEFYPCKPDIFEATYEPVEGQ